jgi:hypothetical protein
MSPADPGVGFSPGVFLFIIPDPPSRYHLPFDRLTALSKAEGLRYASSFVIAAYW